MTKLFETKIIVGGDENKFRARVSKLESSGWTIDKDFFESDVEITGFTIPVWTTRLKRSIYQKANHELPEPPFANLLLNITKEQWGVALEKYRLEFPERFDNNGRLVYGNWTDGGKYLTDASVVPLEAIKEQSDYEQLLNNVLAISDLDRDEFLADFEKWYLNSGTAQSRLYALDLVYTYLATGNGLPWD